MKKKEFNELKAKDVKALKTLVSELKRKFALESAKIAAGREKKSQSSQACEAGHRSVNDLNWSKRKAIKMKLFTGKVIAKSGEKTAKVAVERVVSHPLYHKRLKRIRKYLVHDEVGVQIGTEVKFAASKPYSKLKKWKIVVEPTGGKK